MSTKYERQVEARIEEIAAWTRQGATIKETAARLGVAYSSLRKYLDEGRKGNEQYGALWRAYDQAKEEPDRAVEAALFKRACGYQYVEETVEEKLGKDGGIVELRKRVEKTVPPDTTAAMFWLANNKRTRWQYKPEAKEADEQGSGVIQMPAVAEVEA